MMIEKFVNREDGRREQLCEHGIGHTVYAPDYLKKAWGETWDWHGCDGCCEK